MVGRKECWEDGGQTEEIQAEKGLHSGDTCLRDKSQACSHSRPLALGLSRTFGNDSTVEQAWAASDLQTVQLTKTNNTNKNTNMHQLTPVVHDRTCGRAIRSTHRGNHSILSQSCQQLAGRHRRPAAFHGRWNLVVETA